MCFPNDGFSEKCWRAMYSLSSLKPKRALLANFITYEDSSSYFVVRAAGALDLITWHTYSATAVLFAAISFSGLWALYLVFYHMYPSRHLGMAIAILSSTARLDFAVRHTGLPVITISAHQLFLLTRHLITSRWLSLSSSTWKRFKARCRS